MQPRWRVAAKPASACGAKRDYAMKKGRCSGLEGHCCRPWHAGPQLCMRMQAAVLTCRRSRKDYPQFAELTRYQTLAYEA